MKRNKKIISSIMLLLTIIILFMVILRNEGKTYATAEKENIGSGQIQESQFGKNEVSNIEIEKQQDINNKVDEIDLGQIIIENTKQTETQELSIEEEDLEYITKYEKDTSLPQGIIQVLQEGVTGKQKVVTQKIYQDNKLVREEKKGSTVEKSSINKIVRIGASEYKSTYQVKVGDTLYVTAKDVGIMEEPSTESYKLITINKDSEVCLKEISGEWYKIKYEKYVGWIKAECLTYLNPNAESYVDEQEKSKQTIMKNLKFEMALNKESGLSLDQFKKVLSNNEADKNKVFENNAQYFYYVEKQYKVNGIFVAAVGIHESGWGTSAISRNKKNLFGYGAYDSSPYSSSYSFGDYAEGIDLIGRVFVKYYLNPAGTQIYDGQVATGGNYNGNTLSAVNKKYATDKDWANGVYKWMEYLYNRL